MVQRATYVGPVPRPALAVLYPTIQQTRGGKSCQGPIFLVVLTDLQPVPLLVLVKTGKGFCHPIRILKPTFYTIYAIAALS